MSTVVIEGKTSTQEGHEPGLNASALLTSAATLGTCRVLTHSTLTHHEGLNIVSTKVCEEEPCKGEAH